MRTNLDFTAYSSGSPGSYPSTRFIGGGCDFSLCVPLFFVSLGKDYLESAAACERLSDKNAGRMTMAGAMAVGTRMAIRTMVAF